jgi:hypothetical protein
MCQQYFIEIFRTNVSTAECARQIICSICEKFPGHRANFDLDDCDKILRVVNENENVQALNIIKLLRQLGMQAEVLPG